MSVEVAATSPDATRLLTRPSGAPPSSPSLATLIGWAEAGGLTGRGGSAFPTVRKIKAVAGSGGVVVGNAMEGEPLSRKDAVLLDRSLDLVCEGLSLVGDGVAASRRILALGPGKSVSSTQDVADRYAIEVANLVGGFVAGQETAVVRQLNGGPPLPRDPVVRVTTRGVGNRPTLVLNVETLAHLALIARNGVEWFRSCGTAADPGTSLFTVSGAVSRTVVVEAARGTPLDEVVSHAGPIHQQAVLVGGFHGTWISAADSRVPLDQRSLAGLGASVGAGVLHVLGGGQCPLTKTAEIARWLASEVAGQCGPCVNGMPRIAEIATDLADRNPKPEAAEKLIGMAALVRGRGACAHPDGTARMIESCLRVFEDHVNLHLDGYCPSR